MLHSYPLKQVPFFREDQQFAELMGASPVKADVSPEFQCAHQVECAPDDQVVLSALGSIQQVQRAAILLRRIGADADIAQFFTTERPTHQEPKRLIIRPLPC